MTDDSYERGLRIRREVLGDEHVDRAINQTLDETRDFQDFITRYAWGEIWARPGLDHKTRSMITIAMLVGMGKLDELKLHIRATHNTGVSRDEVKELLMHAAIYCGVPAAFGAFQLAACVQSPVEIDSVLPKRVRQSYPVGISSRTQLVLVGHRPRSGRRPEERAPEARTLFVGPVHQPHGDLRLALLGDAAEHLGPGQHVEAAV